MAEKSYPAPQLDRLRALAGLHPGEAFSLTQRQDFDETPKEVFYAEAAFYTHVETGFFEGMRSYLKQTLGVKSPIIGTNDHTYFIPGMPLLRSTSRMDIVDAHVYWQHPAISGKRDTPMVNDPQHSIAIKLTRSTLLNKPFTVSEVNEPFPSDYEAEMIPILAAYGAFQDWDGIFIYTFEPKVSGQWKLVIGDHFDLAEDPVKIAQIPVGALLFLRHDVESARQIIERTYSREQIDESMRLAQSESPYYTPGFPLSLPLEHGSRIRCLDCQPTEAFHDQPQNAQPQNPIRSDTGQLAWWTSKSKGGLFSIDTDRTTALVGFVRDNEIATSHLAADVKNRFCALTLSSLDGQPLSRSSLLLLTATGRVENTGSVWNARHTMYDVWGTAPTRIEVIQGWLTLKDLEGAVGVLVTPLDGSSKPLGEVRGRLLETRLGNSHRRTASDELSRSGLSASGSWNPTGTFAFLSVIPAGSLLFVYLPGIIAPRDQKQIPCGNDRKKSKCKGLIRNCRECIRRPGQLKLHILLPAYNFWAKRSRLVSPRCNLCAIQW